MNYPGITRTHEQTWHANGRQASLSAPDGTSYGFSWDNANRLQAITIPGQGVIAHSEYQWLQPARIEFPGGTVRENTFDGLQRHMTIRVTNQLDQTLMDYAYTWDETGNITGKNTEHGPYIYAYDDIDRLVEAEYPTFSAETWTYDPLGNRLTDARTGEEEWQYNDNNELLHSVEYGHEYDVNGSLIAEYHPDGSLYRSFDYNAETRLSAVRDHNDQLIAEYLYDPFGRRVSKTVYDPPGQNPETTWYVYSDQGLMAELDGQGNQLDFYLFPPDGLWSTDPIFRKSGASYFYYQTDHLGTPQQMIDGAGSIVHSREMRAFGEVVQSGIEDRWRFPGQLQSQETGLYYNYFRDYAPGLGRYVQSDPIGIWGGRNIFSYGIQSPVLRYDELGLFPNELDPFQNLPRTSFPEIDFICRNMGFLCPGSGQRDQFSKAAVFSVGAGGSGHFLTLGVALESGFAWDTHGTVCFFTRQCATAGIGAAGSIGISGSGGIGNLCSGTFGSVGTFFAGGVGVGGGTSIEALLDSEGDSLDLAVARGLGGPSGGKVGAVIGCEYRFMCVNESTRCRRSSCESQ